MLQSNIISFDLFEDISTSVETVILGTDIFRKIEHIFISVFTITCQNQLLWARSVTFAVIEIMNWNLAHVD